MTWIAFSTLDRSEEHTSELQSRFGISYAVFCFNDTATTEIYTLSLHDALPIWLSAAEKKAFSDAVLALKNDVDSVLHPGQQRRYDDFVEVHKNAMTGPGMFDPMPHGTPLFYPWHRVMLRQFELALQSAATDPTISLPYWDWDMSGLSTPFTADFLGGDGDAAQGGRVVIGPFAYATGKFPIRVWDGPTGDPGLRREFGEDADGK